MAKTQISERDANRELTRRALIKWTVAAGAALGVSRAKILEILEKTADKELAFAAAANPTTKYVHLEGGNAGIAWIQAMWQQVDVVLGKDPKASVPDPASQKAAVGTTYPLMVGSQTPFASLPGARQVTAFVCGTNQTHNRNATSTSQLLGNSAMAAVTALQTTSPSLVPSISIAGAVFGAAPGAPKPAVVANAAGLKDLFNSSASRLGGLLAKTPDAQLYAAHYQGLIQLNRAANRSTTKTAYTTGSVAANYLGVNLASKLTLTPDDLARYGLNANPRNNVAAVGQALATTAKAFAMNLTSSVIIPFMNDDPHTAFDTGDITVTGPVLSKMLNAFYADLAASVDSNTHISLADDFVLSASGDTVKSPTNSNGWGDGTPAGYNMLFVLGGGALKTGYLGSVSRAGQVLGFDTNGKPVPYVAADTAKTALSALLYAVAKRDSRAISNFTGGLVLGDGIVNAKDI